MIHIGFVLAPSKSWLGGINYYKNLFYAISSVQAPDIKMYLFVPKDIDPKILLEIVGDNPQQIQVVTTPLLTRKTSQWFMWRLTRRLWGTDRWVEQTLRQYQIQVFSHSDLIGLNKTKTANWIPDFQHFLLPQFFTQTEILNRTRHMVSIAKQSNLLFVSSYSAQKDLQTFIPVIQSPIKVLQFVSQISKFYWQITPQMADACLTKYGITTPYFYIPNQFWQHKNHKIAFEAIKLLKEQHIPVTLICSGALQDYRRPEYIDEIQQYITEQQLESSIRLLNIIPYDDVQILMKCSKAVINPSLFEGWSSTVEECKSANKRMILSDIPVHREQMDNIGLFFDPYSASSLTNMIIAVLAMPDEEGLSLEDSEQTLSTRTKQFGATYLAAIRSIL